MKTEPSESLNRQSRPKTTGATLADVAQRAGVSPMTVSNVLNGRRKNSPHQAAIMEAVATLNYQPDLHAQRLAAGFSPQTLGLFSSAIDLGVETLLLMGIQKVAREQGYNMPLDVHDIPPHSREEDSASLVRLLCRQRPRAIVFSRANISAKAMEEFQSYQESGGIIVSYGYEIADIACDQVGFDTEANSYLAAMALIQQGHRKIGFRCHGYPVIETPRMRGFRRALQDHGLPYREEWMFSGPLYEEGGARLAEEYLKMKDRPTGLCIVNDNSAWVFVNEMIKAGLRVPEDVSVVGHDDTAPARYCIVPLTTARYPIDEIVQTVTEMLLSRLDGTYSGPPRAVKFDGSIVERRSIGAPKE